MTPIKATSFFARHRYEINPHNVIVYTDFYARAVANILMLIFGAITIPAVILSNVINFHLNGWGSLQYTLISIPFLALPLLFRVILFPFYHTHIVFDADSEIISRHTIFGKKRLCSFAEIANIEHINAYFLHQTNDPYGLGIRITAGFRNAKEQKPFVDTVIPAIEAMLLNARKPAPETCNIPSFYIHTVQLFRLKPTFGSYLVWVPCFWATVLLGTFIWQIVSYNNSVLPVLVLALASIVLGMYEPTTIKQFIINQKYYTVRRYCFFKTYSKSLPQTITLYLKPIIVKGRRKGVEVFLEFPDGSKTSLKQFGNKKTAQIPAFTSETETILRQAGVNTVERKVDVLVRTYKNILI